MDKNTHASLNVVAKQALLLEKIATGLANQTHAMQKDGLPDAALADLRQARMAIMRNVNRMKRDCLKLVAPEPVGAFLSETRGLSAAVAVFLGCVPPLNDFANPAKLWAWCGLAPKSHQSIKYSRTMKAQAIVRLAEPCVKHRPSPYRALYDARRAHTAETHADWSDGHSHNDARRYVAKAILKDLWLVENGKLPVVGGPRTADTQPTRAPATGEYTEAA